MIVAASCSRNGTHVVSGSSELLAAVVRTSALQSVRVVENSSGPHTTRDLITIDYQAPDRLHTIQTGTEADESFQIGSIIYQQVVGRPGYFWTLGLSAHRGTAQNLFGLLQVIKSQIAVKQGGMYRVTLSHGAGSLTVKLGNGYVTELAADSGGVRSVQKFSLFNIAPSVVQPPADHILPAPPPAPKCMPGQQPTPLCIG